MTTTPPESPAQGQDPAVTAANASARAKILGWARRSIDLIPTSWLITGAGAVLLATTAVFGGLEAAAVDPTPVVEVGETFTGSELEMTVVGVELRDELSAESGQTLVFPDEEKGERILVVTVDVVNTFDKPRPSTANGPQSPVLDGIRIEGLDAKGDVLRADDGKRAPRLQPDVPARMLLTWIVGPDDFHDGDEITLTLPDSDHYVGQSVMRGDYWQDVRVGATLPATIDEVTLP
ncbi:MULTISPECIES: hypothetical protein [unclassified Microbacterium]|uniref:hypothetical protein n=1 Tax=unclassified Microbacterium TaxID=2609290 RepID=UPI00109C9A20|nr:MULTISPECIES: hypothetical protein [unclassified Microbacterium]